MPDPGLTMIATPSDRSTILVVDDTPENLLVLGEILQPEFRVRVANSGERALTVARTPPYPDLILLDVMMPGLDGYAVMERLRADPLTCEIPVIFVTALDGAEDEERGLALGAADYLQKPVRASIVRARVRTQLMLRHTRRALAACSDAMAAGAFRRAQEIARAQGTALMALAALAEGGGSQGVRHILRTQAYVAALGQRLRAHPHYAAVLGPGDLEMIVQAVTLHDIGKLGLPDPKLGLGGPSPWSSAGTQPDHCRVGSATMDAIIGVLGDSAVRLAGAPSVESPRPDSPCGTECEGPGSLAFLQAAREIARFHHEHWDGSGFPDGLAGEAIPIPARLMALADAFDALVCASAHLAHAPARAVEESLAEIAVRRGSYYDPEMVDALQSVREELTAAATRYADGPEVPVAPLPDVRPPSLE